MFNIQGKVVLITGAASGIGASVVRNLIEKDVKHVTILDIDEKNGYAIQEELNTEHGNSRVTFIKCDVTDEQELLAAFRTVTSEHDYIDVVINNAGIFNDELFAKEIELNLTALVRSTLRAWNLMRKDEGGRGGTVINIASVAAITHHPPIPVYSATKAAVLKFSTTLGDEFHYTRTGVRVLTICFGVTNTPMTRNEQMKSFEPCVDESMATLIKSLKWQTPEHAAEGLAEIYKLGNSGSVWIVTNGEPALDVTEQYKETNEVFKAIIFK